MKNFTITKNKFKKTDSQPDYKMSIKQDDAFIEIGSCWLKEGKNGKFFSCKLNDVYVDHVKGVARKGFDLVMEESNGNDMPEMPEEVEDIADNAPF